MTQSIVAFSMLSAIVILGSRYTYWQLWSTLTILGGTTVCLFAEGFDESKNNLGFALLQLVSTFPNAMSFTIKELVFNITPTLDIFVVNSYGSLFQLLLWPIFLPLTLLFNQTGNIPFGEYMIKGFQCFAGTLPKDSENDCSSMPWPFLIYIVFNLSFNISLLILLKKASALQGFMAIKAILPFAFILFYFNWPLIGSSNINEFTIIGLFIVIFGLIAYRIATMSKEIHKPDPKFSQCFSVEISLKKKLL